MAEAMDEAQAAWEAMTGPAMKDFGELFREHAERLRGRHPTFRGSPGEWATIALYAENEVLRKIMKAMSVRITELETAVTKPEERP